MAGAVDKTLPHIVRQLQLWLAGVPQHPQSAAQQVPGAVVAVS